MHTCIHVHLASYISPLASPHSRLPFFNCPQIDQDNNGFISVSELDEALKAVGLDLPGYEVRQLMQRYDTDKKGSPGQLDMAEFQALYANEKGKRDIGHTFKKAVTTRKGVVAQGGTSYASSEGTTHTVKEGEEKAFADWIKG